MAGEETKEKKEAAPTCSPCCNRKVIAKRIYKAASSHVGLVLLLIAYSFIGAVIFWAIEGTNESNERAEQESGNDIVEMRDNMIAELWNKSKVAGTNEKKWAAIVKQELMEYETELRDAFGDGLDPDTEKLAMWDFWGSMFYCATVYTTIGYGHIAPATWGGKLLTIIYAIIGIPLCLIVLTDMGKLLTRGIKFVWSFIRRFYHTGKCLKERGGQQAPAEESKDEPDIYVVDDEFNLPIPVAVGITVVYILLGSGMYLLWEDNWDFLDAFYFIFISVSTIGFGDVLPDHPRYFLLTSLYVLVGLALVSMVINVIMESMEKKSTEIIEEMTTKAAEGLGLDLSDLEEEGKSPSISSEDKKK